MLWAGSVEMIRTLSRPLDSWTARLQLGKEKVKRQKVRDRSLLSRSSWGDAVPSSRGLENMGNCGIKPQYLQRDPLRPHLRPLDLARVVKFSPARCLLLCWHRVAWSTCSVSIDKGVPCTPSTLS